MGAIATSEKGMPQQLHLPVSGRTQNINGCILARSVQFCGIFTDKLTMQLVGLDYCPCPTYKVLAQHGKGCAAANILV